MRAKLFGLKFYLTMYIATQKLRDSANQKIYTLVTVTFKVVTFCIYTAISTTFPWLETTSCDSACILSQKQKSYGVRSGE